MEKTDTNTTLSEKKKFGCLQIAGIILGAVLITALLTTWWVKHNIYASLFTPTTLNSKEQKVLDTKLTVLNKTEEGSIPSADSAKKVHAVPYSEKGADRSISLTEKEMNFLVASDAEMAKRVAIDLAQDLVSVKLIVPLEEDFPIFGGKTIRLNMGLKLGYANGRPIVALQGVSLGGVPLPNAWLGNMKHTNLVQEFGSETGFWKLFANGVENISVQDGQIKVQLKE